MRFPKDPPSQDGDSPSADPRSNRPDSDDDLAERYYASVYNLALRILRDPDDAADATQEILIKAWGRLSTFRGDAKLATWLHRIATRHCCNFARGRKRRNGHLHNEKTEEVDDPLIPEDPAPHERRLSMGVSPYEDDAWLRVHEALDRLSNALKEAVVLHYLLECSYREISEILDISEEAVHSRIRRAKNQLAELMRDIG